MRSFNEEAYQAALKDSNYSGLGLVNEVDPGKSREIFNFYFKLNEQIDVSQFCCLIVDLRLVSPLAQNTGQFIKKVVNEHENDFLAAFEQKMYIVQKDMRDLKEKASVERIKAKQEARLVNMESERDWFRREALELDKMNKDHKRVIAELKARLEAVSEDKEFMH